MNRLKALEKKIGPERCPDCGSNDHDDAYDVELEFGPDDGYAVNAHCTTCGRPLLIVVRWVDGYENAPAA